MARDYARKSRPASKRKSPSASRRAAAGPAPGSALRWYLAGLLSGVVLGVLGYGYLSTLPAEQPAASGRSTAGPQPEAPAPRFDFYTRLQEQRPGPAPEEQSAPSDNASPEPAKGDYYLLQAGSFRQQEDADRRRAELLLLGLEPRIEPGESDSGRWYRVYLGPFESHADMSRARSLTAAQQIETLLLKRSR